MTKTYVERWDAGRDSRPLLEEADREIERLQRKVELLQKSRDEYHEAYWALKNAPAAEPPVQLLKEARSFIQHDRRCWGASHEEDCTCGYVDFAKKLAFLDDVHPAESASREACSRAHPHENMNAECQRLAHIAQANQNRCENYPHCDICGPVKSGEQQPPDYEHLYQCEVASKMVLQGEHDSLKSDLHAMSNSAETLEALKTAHQALLEVLHAQDVGPGWYTRGASGLFQQTRMWIRRGLEALNKTRPIWDPTALKATSVACGNPVMRCARSSGPCEQPEGHPGECDPLCPHGLPLAANICGPCSKGEPTR